jgi:hypothetical protein
MLSDKEKRFIAFWEQIEPYGKARFALKQSLFVSALLAVFSNLFQVFFGKLSGFITIMKSIGINFAILFSVLFLMYYFVYWHLYQKRYKKLRP